MTIQNNAPALAMKTILDKMLEDPQQLKQQILLSDLNTLHYMRWYGFEAGNDEISEDDF